MPISNIDGLSTREKLEAMESLWEALCSNPESVPSPEWHGGVLAERDRDYLDGRETPERWESVKERLRGELPRE